jgi:hypothetical protein
MSLNYTENRIKEALRLSNGNTNEAKKQIFAWLYEDHKLLLDITRPHLNGIVAYGVDRVLRRMLKSDDELLEDEAQEASHSSSKKGQVGKEILKGFIAKDAPQFGQESVGVPLRKRAASQNHIDTMHLLAATAKKKLRDNI